MMTQNIPYKGYLSSKWWLMVIATIVTTTIASFYLYFGVQVYLTIIGAIYNIGVNSHLVLLVRVHKTPIDLSSGKGFGTKSNVNHAHLYTAIRLPVYCIGWVQNLETQT
jgi:hypothetical protein